MSEGNTEYRGSGKTSAVVASTLGYGLVGHVIGRIPAGIATFSSTGTFAERLTAVKGWHGALTWGATLAGAAYGSYRGYTKADQAEADHRSMRGEIDALKGENSALKAAWQEKVKSDPETSSRGRA